MKWKERMCAGTPALRWDGIFPGLQVFGALGALLSIAILVWMNVWMLWQMRWPLLWLEPLVFLAANGVMGVLTTINIQTGNRYFTRYRLTDTAMELVRPLGKPISVPYEEICDISEDTVFVFGSKRKLLLLRRTPEIPKPMPFYTLDYYLNREQIWLVFAWNDALREELARRCG